jgi:hypothetical protein
MVRGVDSSEYRATNPWPTQHFAVTVTDTPAISIFRLHIGSAGEISGFQVGVTGSALKYARTSGLSALLTFAQARTRTNAAPDVAIASIRTTSLIERDTIGFFLIAHMSRTWTGEKVDSEVPSSIPSFQEATED